MVLYVVGIVVLAAIGAEVIRALIARRNARLGRRAESSRTWFWVAVLLYLLALAVFVYVRSGLWL